jgi:hypothetical protein
MYVWSDSACVCDDVSRSSFEICRTKVRRLWYSLNWDVQWRTYCPTRPREESSACFVLLSALTSHSNLRSRCMYISLIRSFDIKRLRLNLDILLDNQAEWHGFGLWIHPSIMTGSWEEFLVYIYLQCTHAWSNVWPVFNLYDISLIMLASWGSKWRQPHVTHLLIV